MADALVDIAVVEKQTAMLLEANPDDGSYAAASATDQQKYHPSEITKAALIIDIEVCLTIIDTPDNGDRNHFLVDSADLANGARIAAHPGKIGAVEIKLANGTYKPGILVKNFDAMQKYLVNPDGIYGTTAQNEGRYSITEEGIIYFVGSAARIRIAPDLAMSNACQAPQKYTGTVIRGTLALLYKPNEIEAGFFSFYAMQYQRDLMLIRSGAAALPPLEQAKRAA